ncbi:MAG: UDP-3-O-(3-hydroxymyristoyl)glucosamine N-acyltransferase [Alphaproteobacteria bacterium]|nr:MAG: UDP-3-O-(3-hydroxymyristoyl)glucosamine N-acyltransferase [Alphaproteobacteria bacterium]
MKMTLGEVAAAIGARLEGDPDIVIRGAAEPAAAGPEHLALATNPRYAEALGRGAARAAVLWEGADWRAMGLDAALFVARPRYALAHLTAALDPGPGIAAGIHPTAIVEAGATVGPGAAVGPFAVIGAGVTIGRNARIGPHVVIGAGAALGDDVLLHAGARVGERVTLGDRVIVQPGAVIGADGFSFVTPDKSAVEAVRENLGGSPEAAAPQAWTRIHSLGAVRVGDDVEIGANTTIDRGTVADTVIGRGTKLDNLVHVGHNVVIGEDCLLCGQVGVAGSARIGDRVVLAGQCGVSDHVTVGSDVIAGGATKIFTNVPSGRAVLGMPAVRMEQQVEIYKALRRLPRLFELVRELKKAVPKSAKND